MAVTCGQTNHARRYQGSYCQNAICKAAVRPIAVIEFVCSSAITGPLLRLLLCHVRLDQLNGEELERIGDRNEEIDACRHPRDGKSGNAYSDDIAEPVDHRSPAVARMNGSVALQERKIVVPAIGTDDAFGYGRRILLFSRRPYCINLGGNLGKVEPQ